LEKIDLSKHNPFVSYKSNFGAYFSFGPEFDVWVRNTMLEAILPDRPATNGLIRLADIGAGSCYWARLFIKALAGIEITAVDPSVSLILEQASHDIAMDKEPQDRLIRRCMSAQDFAEECRSPDHDYRYNCIYFMQSAHYVGDDEFKNVFSGLAKGLRKQNSSKIVIQARNMTKSWYPWAFPFEWKEKIEDALSATSMFDRANRYKEQLEAMSDVFRDVSVHERRFDVHVEAEDYWDRLENRWIPTFMSEDIIPPPLHRKGIDAMKARFAVKNESSVNWVEKYALVTAHLRLE
jgi:hypothetical protein